MIFLETDLIPASATFLSCLFIRLELGIVIGIGINVLFLLYASARPSVHVEKVTVSILLLLSSKYTRNNNVLLFIIEFIWLRLFTDHT